VPKRRGRTNKKATAGGEDPLIITLTACHEGQSPEGSVRKRAGP